MKKIFYSLSLVAFYFSPAAAQKNAIVQGHITSQEKIQKVYLYYQHSDNSVTDSTDLNNGNFKFTAPVTEPTYAMLRLQFAPKDDSSQPGFEVKQLFIEPGTMTINVNDSLTDAKISGGIAEKDFENLQKMEKPFNEKMRPLNEQYMKYRAAKDEAGMQKISDQFDILDSTRNEEVFPKYLKKYPKSPVAMYALNQYAGYDINPEKISPVFASLSPEVQNSPSGKAFKKRIETAKKTAVGSYAINFIQNDTLGKPTSLSSFKGKYVLLDFWASWCGPCRAENPNVVKAFDKYKDKNFTVLSVSLDQPGKKQAWLDAIHKDSLTWTHVSDLKFWNNAVAKLYGIRAIPQNLLLDPTGKIIAKNIRGDELNKKLSEIFE